MHSPHYPSLLKHCPDPPLALYVSGTPQCLSSPAIAVIGSRNPSPSGKETAFEFAQQLTQCGFCIVSGLAIGIDGASHRGCLQAKGQTIAVLGSGLNKIYPARHRMLAQHIVAQNGALISEYPLQAPPLPAYFPQRNRLIAGMSLGCLVVEANLKSGSLITAKLAVEQGREVFAIPGSIYNPTARGCHHLIRNGAKLVETTRDITEELAPLNKRLTMDNKLKRPLKTKNVLDEAHHKLLECVGYEATSIDTLLIRSQKTASTLHTMLLKLELDNLIQLTQGGYVRVTP